MLGALVRGLDVAVLQNMQPESKNHGHRCQDQWGECIYCVCEFSRIVYQKLFHIVCHSVSKSALYSC